MISSSKMDWRNSWHQRAHIRRQRFPSVQSPFVNACRGRWHGRNIERSGQEFTLYRRMHPIRCPQAPVASPPERRGSTSRSVRFPMSAVDLFIPVSRVPGNACRTGRTPVHGHVQLRVGSGDRFETSHLPLPYRRLLMTGGWWIPARDHWQVQHVFVRATCMCVCM